MQVNFIMSQKSLIYKTSDKIPKNVPIKRAFAVFFTKTIQSLNYVRPKNKKYHL
jgi:hypothetical protein